MIQKTSRQLVPVKLRGWSGDASGATPLASLEACVHSPLPRLISNKRALMNGVFTFKSQVPKALTILTGGILHVCVVASSISGTIARQLRMQDSHSPLKNYNVRWTIVFLARPQVSTTYLMKPFVSIYRGGKKPCCNFWRCAAFYAVSRPCGNMESRSPSPNIVRAVQIGIVTDQLP